MVEVPISLQCSYADGYMRKRPGSEPGVCSRFVTTLHTMAGFLGALQKIIDTSIQGTSIQGSAQQGLEHARLPVSRQYQHVHRRTLASRLAGTLRRDKVEVLQSVPDALERRVGRQLSIADDTDAADGAEVGLVYERRKELAELVHAAEVLDLDIVQRQMSNECLEEVLGVLAFNQELNAAIDAAMWFPADAIPLRCHAQRNSRLWRTTPSIASSL